MLRPIFWAFLLSMSPLSFSSPNDMLMPTAFPHFPSRSVLRLDGLWDFSFMEKCHDPLKPDLAKVTYTEKLAVPGVFDAMPQYAGKRGTAFYRTFVTAPPNARMLLKSGGLGMWGAFFWDGQFIGLQDLPYSGMEFEFNSGEGNRHELVAVIDNRFNFKRQPLLSQNYDYYCFGGIFRSIELHQLPPLAIDRAQVSTVSLEGKIQVKVKLTGQFHTKKIDVTYQIDDGEAVKLSCDVFHEVATFNATVPNPSIWSTTSPALHTIAITIGNDTVVERFGLRTIKAEKGQILLNGEPLRLHGYCRHESHPEFGPALPLQVVLEDIQLLKKTGCNFVRGSHYPQDQRFLNLCDENGILVWEETVGWGDRENHLMDPAFREAQLRQLPWMVKNSFNHPCVIFWGFLNEGDSSLPKARKVYEEMIGTLRKLDDTRLITYASNAYTKDFNFDLVDVISINAYPGWYAANQETMRPIDEIRPKFDHFIKFLHESAFDDKPFIISEVGAGAIYGWRDRLRAHWSEEYQADFLDEVLTYFDETPRIAGIALWQLIDCRTYSSSRALGRPRAFNNKGLFDEYRRPKLAFDVVSKHYNKP